MSSEDPAVVPPRVVGVLVVRNGAEWLPGVLATLARLTYPDLELVAVDCASTDGSSELLAKRFPADRVIRLEDNVGFGRALAAAIAQSEAVAEADLLWLLHDDLVVGPRSLSRLVRAMTEDPSLHVVGLKLREWSEGRVLQEVGMTVDRLGRAESQLEPAELDQGQHDVQRPVLYVSTAGMLLRREVLREVGGFDPRFPAFRDDLDLCWRTWLSGRRVEVVPSAVGYHIAAASRLARPVSSGRPWDARYLAERHTLATLLKNYGAARLLWVLPVVVLVGFAKSLGFLATRRFGDALATVAAYAWNVAQMPRTLRRRRLIQRRRAVSDGELMHLFAPGLPRLRSYGEALGSWLAGGSTKALLDDQGSARADADELSGLRALVRAIREHPAVTAAVVLGIGYLIGLVPLLGAGQLIGGDVAPWPSEATAFLAEYTSPWNGEPLAGGAFASPIQALLGLVSLAGLGSAWLAQRLVVLGLLPLAWALALRAGRLITARPAPRVLGATLYALSPVVLGAFAQGRLGLLIVAALLPGLLLVGIRASDSEAPKATTWRATALLALGLVAVAAADASLLPLVAVLPIILLVASAVRDRDGRREATVRVAIGCGLAVLVLLPWLVDLVRLGWTRATPPVVPMELPLWRALGLVPEVLPGVGGFAGVLAAATAAAVILAALLLGMRVRPVVVAGLLLLWTIAGVSAWGLARLGLHGLWPPAVLLPAALALAGLGVLAARWLTDSLAGYAFGARQLVTVGIIAVLGVGVGGMYWRLADGPWTGLQLAPELVPAFVTADAPRVGPYRIVLLSQDAQGVVRWDVTEAQGPQMTAYGTVPNVELTALLEEAVALTVTGTDPAGGGRLGAANVRYVVAPADGAPPGLVAALDRQPLLEPAPAGGARVWRVRSWLPRAAVLPGALSAQLAATGDPGAAAAVETEGLRPVRRDRFAGDNPVADGGLLVLSEGPSTAWRANGDGQRLERAEVAGLNAFSVPAGVERVAVEHGGATLHVLLLILQGLLVLGIVSLALRPPGTGPRRGAAPRGRHLPEALEELDDDTEQLVVPAALSASRGDRAPSAVEGAGPQAPADPTPPAGEAQP